MVTLTADDAPPAAAPPLPPLPPLEELEQPEIKADRPAAIESAANAALLAPYLYLGILMLCMVFSPPLESLMYFCCLVLLQAPAGGWANSPCWSRVIQATGSLA